MIEHNEPQSFNPAEFCRKLELVTRGKALEICRLSGLKQARDYLSSRGVTPPTIDYWLIDFKEST